MVKAAGKAKDMSVVTHEVDDVLAYARRMAGFAAEQEAAAAAGDELPYLVGIPGTPNVIGGPLGGSEKARDVKDLFRAYLELRLEAAGELSEAVEDDAVLLQQVLCLPEREAKNLSDEVVAKLYRKLLREEVVSGRLAAAPKPSAVLGDLVDRIRFNPEAAVELHKQLYKDKLARLLVERGRKLTDADEEVRGARHLTSPHLATCVARLLRCSRLLRCLGTLRLGVLDYNHYHSTRKSSSQWSFTMSRSMKILTFANNNPL